MSSAGLSKQLRALESHLGAVLIQRTTRKMSLTDTGTAYYAECCRLLDELDALEKSVRQQSQRVSGRLRVNAPLSFALSVLSPLLARFLRQYPELRRTCPWKTAGGRGGPGLRRIDPAARAAGRFHPIARRLVSLTQVLCAAPSYLQAHGHPRDADALRGHAILSYSRRMAPPRSRNPDRPRTRRPAGPRPVNNSLMLRDLLVAGLGIGALPSFLADPAIADGRLARVLPDLPAAPRHVYAVYPTSRHLQPKVKAFVDFLAEHLPATLSGDS